MYILFFYYFYYYYYYYLLLLLLLLLMNEQVYLAFLWTFFSSILIFFQGSDGVARQNSV